MYQPYDDIAPSRLEAARAGAESVDVSFQVRIPSVDREISVDFRGLGVRIPADSLYGLLTIAQGKPSVEPADKFESNRRAERFHCPRSARNGRRLGLARARSVRT